ncbi:MAG: copper resistance protein CopC [Thermoleophilia bacterium]
MRPRAPLAALAAVLALLAAAPAALAHATLIGSAPADEAVVDGSPAAVVLRFDEQVEASFGAVRVYDGAARRVDTGSAERPDVRSASAALRPDLPDGTYTVAWRVVSADGHPVRGAFVFHVGAPGENAAGVGDQVLDEGTPRAVGVSFDVVRGIATGTLLLAAGGVLALALVLGGAPARVRRALLTWIVALASLCALASLAAVLLQGMTASGLGPVDVLTGPVLGDVLDTRVGQAWLGRAVAAVALALLAAALLRRPRPGLLLDGAIVVAVLLCLGPAVGGHARISGPVAFLTDAVHVLAAAVWVGGLASVALAIWLAGPDRRAVAARALPRLSTAALVAVGVLLACGVVNGYLQVRSWDGLLHTTYGQLVLVKAGLLVPLVALGAYQRLRSVPAARMGGQAAGFVRATAHELGLMVAVVAVTAVLAAEPPARAVVQPSGPFSTFAAIGELEVDVTVDPARRGGNEVHLYLLDASGRLTDVDALELEATLPSRGVGPLEVDVRRLGPGHWTAPSARLPLAGAWQLRVVVRQGEVDQSETTIAVPVR